MAELYDLRINAIEPDESICKHCKHFHVERLKVSLEKINCCELFDYLKRTEPLYGYFFDEVQNYVVPTVYSPCPLLLEQILAADSRKA